MKQFRNKYRRFDEREYLDYLYKVLYNLCINGFLEPKDEHSQYPLEGWIVLTVKGADYMHGGPLTVNKVDFCQYILLSDADNKQFDDLWLMIGEKDKAPFYIKGPTFLNMIRPYLTIYVSDYMTYMDERRNKELSTSRRVWYKELYLNVPADKRADFLHDLSYAVCLSYYYPEVIDNDYLYLYNDRLEAISEQFEREVPQLPQINVAESNKRQTQRNYWP